MRESFEDQTSQRDEQFVTDWKRKKFGYETAFHGEEYHIVRDLDDTDHRVVNNSARRPLPEPSGIPFEDQTSRPQALNNLNEARFE